MFGREGADRSAHPALRSAADEAFELLQSTIVECQRAGFVVAGDAGELAVAAWSAVHGLSALLVDAQLDGRGGGRPDELAERVAAALFLGIGAPAMTGRGPVGA